METTKLYKNKEWLENEFQTTKYAEVIGRKIGVSGDTITKWRKKFNIPKPEKCLSHARKHTLNESFFHIIDTEEKAYWLGFLMADGAIPSVGKNKPYSRLSIILKEDDIDHLEKFIQALESDYEIKTKDLNDKRGFTTSKCEVNISSKELVDDLISHGVVPNKTGKELIPDINQNLIKHFIRGYFDGDGSLAKSKSTATKYSYSFKIGTSSLKLIEQIIEYFKKIGLDLHYQIYTKYSIPFYILETRKKSTVRTILNEIYSNPKICLTRKFNRIQEFLSAPLHGDMQLKTS